MMRAADHAALTAKSTGLIVANAYENTGGIAKEATDGHAGANEHKSRRLP